jgi:hypothetical protein
MQREKRLRDIACLTAQLYNKGSSRAAAQQINLVKLQDMEEFNKYLEEYMEFYTE